MIDRLLRHKPDRRDKIVTMADIAPCWSDCGGLNYTLTFPKLYKLPIIEAKQV